MSARFQRMNDVQSSYTCTPAPLRPVICGPVADPPELPSSRAHRAENSRASASSLAAAAPPRCFRTSAFALRCRSSPLRGVRRLAWSPMRAEGRRPRWAALRLLKPVWAWTGTRFPRSVVAFSLLLLALFGSPRACSRWDSSQRRPSSRRAAAFGDLCASCAAERHLRERRSAAFAWLDMAQASGGHRRCAGCVVPAGRGDRNGGRSSRRLNRVPTCRIAAPPNHLDARAHEHVLHSRSARISSRSRSLAASSPCSSPRGRIHVMALLFPLAGMAIAARADPYMRTPCFCRAACWWPSPFVPAPAGLLPWRAVRRAAGIGRPRGRGDGAPVASSLVWSLSAWRRGRRRVMNERSFSSAARRA